VVDDEGQPVPPGQIGHLLIKGPTTALYYWKRRDRTRRAMLGEWLATGDMVWRDADGYFYVAGRADDMLKIGGQWVSPGEIEAHLVEPAAVLEAGVVRRADGDGLAALCAYVALRPGGTATAEELAELGARAAARLQDPAMDRDRAGAAADGHGQDPALPPEDVALACAWWSTA
jgi:acyl-coenzyme A synthetase/AMP-(fatty) acid ligase